MVDVYEEEPVIGAAHSLLYMPHVLYIPHLGYVESSSYEVLYSVAVASYSPSGTSINVTHLEAMGKR
jgi:D-3-phosphoglycerate dehydrogenase